MAVDPHSLTMPPCPMSLPPGIIRMACVITKPVNVIGAIANCNRYRTRITSIIRSTVSTVIGSVIAGVTSVIPFAACYAQHDAHQDEQQNRAFRFHCNEYSQTKEVLGVARFHHHVNFTALFCGKQQRLAPATTVDGENQYSRGRVHSVPFDQEIRWPFLLRRPVTPHTGTFNSPPRVI